MTVTNVTLVTVFKGYFDILPMRWRYGNSFAINNQSLYVYGVHQFGLEKGVIHYNDCRTIGEKLKGLEIYQLGLITIYAMVEIIKQRQGPNVDKDVLFLQ